MNHKKQSNLDEKHDVFFPQPHTFNVSKKLTSDSMMIYSINDKKVFESDWGDDLQFENPQTGQTPLMKCVLENNLPTLDILINRGCDVNYQGTRQPRRTG